MINLTNLLLNELVDNSSYGISAAQTTCRGMEIFVVALMLLNNEVFDDTVFGVAEYAPLRLQKSHDSTRSFN